MLKIVQERGSAAEKSDEGPQVESSDARVRGHPRRRVVGGRVGDLDTDPGRVSPPADVGEIGRPATPEIAKTVAVAAALAHEHLPAAVRARARHDDRANGEAEADRASHDQRLYPMGRREDSVPRCPP